MTTEDPAADLATAIRGLIAAMLDHRGGGIGADKDLSARQRDLVDAIRGALAGKRKSGGT